MIQIAVLLGLLLFVGLAVQRILQSLSTSSSGFKDARRWLIWAAVILGLALAATGRLGILIPLVGALIAGIVRVLPVLLPMLMQYLPLWKRWHQQQQAARQTAGGGSTGSSVESRYLRMHLDHVNGEISGDILAGRYAGRRLADLDRQQLTDLYAECFRGDRESATLLQAYLERIYGADWQTDRGRAEESAGSGPAGGGRMTTDEAYEVLGLKPGASRKDIVAAHRRLMQKLHPDRGGSDYLAAKINAAKDVLLAA